MFDIYQTVTDKLISAMETHGADWMNPMKKGAFSFAARNAITGAAYQGINQFLLASNAYTIPAWATFKAWLTKDCCVQKGEKGTMIVYWNITERKDKATGEVKKSFMLRYYTVFNVAQVKSTSEKGEAFLDTLAATPAAKSEAEQIAACDAFVKATGADIRYTERPQAFYSPAGDYCHVPVASVFTKTATSTATESFYSTTFHELAHWTGHASRLSRDLSGRFGAESYAMEELVAEMAAAMLCAQMGVSIEPRADHAQYLNNWLRVLKGDNKAIMKAATLAKNAAAYLSKSSEAEGEAEAA